MKHPCRLIFTPFVFLLLQSCGPETTSGPAPVNESPASMSASIDSDAIDLIIEGDYIVTMDVGGNVIPNGALAIDGGLIVAMGSAENINTQYTAKAKLPGENRIVMPGLINGHSHAAMTLLRGVADDLALLDWLTNYIFPAEVEFVDAEFVRIGTELACWEMIRGGTTTFVDMYYFPDIVAQVVESCGLRALSYRSSVTFHQDRQPRIIER